MTIQKFPRAFRIIEMSLRDACPLIRGAQTALKWWTLEPAPVLLIPVGEAVSSWALTFALSSPCAQIAPQHSLHHHARLLALVFVCRHSFHQGQEQVPCPTVVASRKPSFIPSADVYGVLTKAIPLHSPVV